LRILVSGSTGLIGSALIDFLESSDATITRLVRDSGWVQAVRWNPMAGSIEQHLLGEYDAVIHLAGESLTGGRWTPSKRRRILESRVRGTRLLAESLAALRRPPRVMVSASAIGFYGNRGEELLREESSPGEGFLADVCRRWEEAAAPAAEAGIRVVHPRIGMVLSSGGGALKKLLRPFRLGLGGTIGGGDQIMSWIGLDDLVGALLHTIFTPTLSGPVNVVAPESVSNFEFTRTLGRVVRRPAILTVPGPVLRAMYGRMADEVLLASARVEPRKLLASGFRFRFPDLESALRHLLTNSKRSDRATKGPARTRAATSERSEDAEA
jgi:uncharacterized protein (TIGR01777 family)